MGERENNGEKILVTMIGASNPRDTEYAFFESCTDENHEIVYRKKVDATESNVEEKYEYPFWAKLKAMPKEKSFDQIVFIGTQASKWECLLSNAERLANSSQNNKVDKNIEGEELSEKSDDVAVMEQLNRYVNQLIGTGYNQITEKEFPKIKGYLKDLLMPETKKQEKVNKEQQKHMAYVQENMSEEKLHEYEKRLSDNITLAVYGTDNPKIKVKIILIREGRTESENRENIIKIQKELSSISISEITLDVTNGLRSQPMYVLSIINNISAIGNRGIPVNIYYGMFDAKLMKANPESKENKYIVPGNPRDGVVAPMVDLKEIQTMDKWTRAISEFFSNGSVLQIIELLEDLRREKAEKNHTESDQYIDAFESFSLAVNSNNLSIFEDAMRKIDMIKKDNRQETDSKEESEIPIYIQKCLDQIILHISEQFRTEDAKEQTKYSFYMFALANWYLQQNRLGDSVRTFQEAVITYVMEQYPSEISNYLEKKMIQWTSSNKKVSDVIFDAKVRKVVRDGFFEDESLITGKEIEYEEWTEWVQEYHYMKAHIHDPDALLYHLEQSEENETKSDIKFAKKMIEEFAKKMQKEIESQNSPCMFKKRIDYLLGIPSYDVFISYRRSYHMADGSPLHDGVLLVTAFSDYFKEQGLKVFVDRNEMKGKQGEFSRHLRLNLLNSKLCLIVLGKDAYARDFAEDDEFYKEIITAVQNNMKIAVICMEDFDAGGKKEIKYGKGVADQKELMRVVKSYQRIGAAYTDHWRYENIISLRECAYEEIKKMLEEE